MINNIDSARLQNKSLEVTLIKAGIWSLLTPQIKEEFDYWRQILENEVKENTELRDKLKKVNDSREQMKKELEDYKEIFKTNLDKLSTTQQAEINKLQRNNKYLQDKLKDTNDNFQKLGNSYQKATDKIKELETDLDTNDELLAEKNQAIVSLNTLLAKKKKKTIALLGEVDQQSRANRKKKKQLQRARLRISVAKQDNQSLQQEITNKSNLINQLQTENNQQKATITKKTIFINRQQQKIIDLKKDERDLQIVVRGLNNDQQNLQRKINQKDQKIAELEQTIQELRNKPPIQFDKSENSPESEPNNFLTEKNKLFNTIKQQKETIQQLQTQLSQTNSPEPQLVVREIPIENSTVIQHLKKELKNKEQTITQLHLIYLLILGGVSFWKVLPKVKK